MNHPRPSLLLRLIVYLPPLDKLLLRWYIRRLSISQRHRLVAIARQLALS